MNQLIKDVLGIKSKDKENPEDIFNLPIKDIADLIISSDNKYVALGKVSPINGDLMQEDNLYNAFESVKGALSTFDGRMGIYILSERVDIETNLQNIEKRKLELNSELQILVLEQCKSHLAKLTDKSRNVTNFYIALEIKKANNYAAAEQLSDDAFNNIKNELENSEMFCERLREKDVKALLYEKMNPESSQSEPLQDDWNLNNILPENVKRYKDGRHIEIENQIYRFYSITKFPQTVDKYRWLRRIFKFKGNINIAITLTPKNKAKINDELSKAVREIGRKALDDKLPEHLKIQYQEEEKSAIEMIRELGADNINLYDANITIGISAKNINDLNTLSEKLRGVISSSFCQSTELKYKGFEPFFITLPILAENKITKNYVWNLSTADIASLIPFDSSEYMESKGTLIGENVTSNGLVILNYYNKIYNNGHLAVVADPGSGKTFFLYCDAIRNLPYVDYTIIFDPKGDFYFPWGKRYVFSATSGIILNPFHIRNAIIDSENEIENGNVDVGNYLAQKIMDLIVFFKWIVKDMTPFDEALLEEDIRDAYKKFELDFDSKTLPEVFPDWTSLGDIMQEKIDNPNTDMEKERRTYLLSCFRPYISGAYSKMFNGQTNWDFDFFTVLDISNLPEAVKKPVYDILLKDTWQFAKKDGTKKPTIKRVYVDECHELADPTNPQSLIFISQKLNKQGRGFGVRLVVATQNLPDFLSIERFGQAIIDNSYFKFFMRLGETDLPVAQKLYGFSKNEMDILKGNNSRKKGSKGRGVFFIGSQRVAIQVMASKFELEIIDPVQYEEIYGVPARYKKGSNILTEVM